MGGKRKAVGIALVAVVVGLVAGAGVAEGVGVKEIKTSSVYSQIPEMKETHG